MAVGSSFEGFLRFSLVVLPVRAYNATSQATSGGMHFHQIHAKCGNRIKYEKVCPIHGPVPKDEIVSGYEYEKGEYITMKPEEITKAKSENTKAITIEHFVPPTALDPIYLAGRTFYLAPATPAGQAPYAVLARSMADLDRWGIARLVLAGHDETAVIRPIDRVLAMTTLHYGEEVKEPGAFGGNVPEIKVANEELELAKTLVNQSTTNKFDAFEFKDTYEERLEKLVEAKAHGKRIRVPGEAKEPVILNLMDALRKSLGQTKPEVAGRGKPPRKHAASKKPARRRKTG
jgi:DNA end-binding protein Ku